MTNLIGISGKIRSGKDTLAKMIWWAMGGNNFDDIRDYYMDDFVSNNPEKWQIKKFADKLKEVVCLLIGCTREQLEDHKFKGSILPPMWDILEFKWPKQSKLTKFPATKYYIDKFPDAIRRSITVREMLQLIGTDCMRDRLHAHTWINALFSSYTTSKWLISDVRFLNEVEAIKERGGIVIRIERNNETARYLKGERFYGHESETALDSYPNWDIYIRNSGSLSELYEQAEIIVETYKLK